MAEFFIIIHCFYTNICLNKRCKQIIYGVVKLVSELTQDEILKGYPKLKSIGDLFESDILILPDIKSSGAFIFPLRLDIKKEYGNLKINYYANDQEKLRYFSRDSIPDFTQIIDFGVLVLSTIGSLITIGDHIKKNNGSKNITQIKIQLFNKTVNNTYIYHNYEGDLNVFCNSELEKMKDDFKSN